MTWTNKLFNILLLNSLSGGMIYGIWLLVKKYLSAKKKIKYIYPLLWVVIVSFCFPFMYLYLQISVMIPGEPGWTSGILFVRTPSIYWAQCIIGAIWIGGVLLETYLYVREYRKFLKILKGNIPCLELEEKKNRIQRELAIKQKIKIYQNYAVDSPIVKGIFVKKIILPVKEYNDREIETILYHEMVHIRQHILVLKQTGVILKIVYWCNPMMNHLLRNIDQWGEIACDRFVCNETKYGYTIKEYYNVAVDELEQSGIWMPKMVTGFKKKSNFKERIIQLSHYRKENDLKRAGAILLSIVFCTISGTTIYAAGEGFRAGYEKVFDATKVMVEVEEDNTIEYEEEFHEENYSVIYQEEEVTMEEDDSFPTISLPEGALKILTTVHAETDDLVIIKLLIDPTDEYLQYGIISSDGDMYYVYGTGGCIHNFWVEESGDYQIFVANQNAREISVEGKFKIL